MDLGIFPVTGSACRTGCSGTGAKFPEIWILGSAVFGRGCSNSRAVKAFSTASKAIAAALCSTFHCGVDGDRDGDGDFDGDGEGKVVVGVLDGVAIVVALLLGEKTGGYAVLAEAEVGVDDCFGKWSMDGVCKEQLM